MVRKTNYLTVVYHVANFTQKNYIHTRLFSATAVVESGGDLHLSVSSKTNKTKKCRAIVVAFFVLS